MQLFILKGLGGGEAGGTNSEQSITSYITIGLPPCRGFCEGCKVRWRDRTIEDAFVTLTLKPDGGIDHFTLAAVSPLADFSFDYQDFYFTPERAEAGKK